MTHEERARLDRLIQVVDAAVYLLRRELPALEEFLEAADLDSERRAALAVMQPILAAAYELVAAHDRQIGRATAALLAVQEMR